MATTAAVVGSVASVASGVHSYKKAKEEKKLAKQEAELAKKEVELQKAEIKEKQKIYEQEKKDLLKQRVASKKAKMAANGLDFTDGSSAVLLGSMEKEVDQDIRNNDFFSDLNLKSNEANYNYKKSKNLLKQKEANWNVTNNLLKLL
jgi:hypothetical protein